MKKAIYIGLMTLSLLTTTVATPALAAGMDEIKYRELSNAELESMKIEKRLSKLDKKLDLTSDQRSRIDAAMQNKYNKLQSLNREYKNKNKSDAYANRKVAIFEEYQNEVHSVLTPKQRKSYDKLVAKEVKKQDKIIKHSMIEMHEE